jgi:hypothetical protein
MLTPTRLPTALPRTARLSDLLTGPRAGTTQRTHVGPRPGADLHPGVAPPTRRRRLIAAVATLLATWIAAPGAWAFTSGSTGADGALNPTVNTEIQLPPTGVLNYTTINIPSGVTVRFKRNASNTPVYLLATGNVTIAGVINVSGSTAAATGTSGDGAVGDDGAPGEGGPGGYDGGRGGRDDLALTPAIIRGGAGLGPGGGLGGVEGGDGCGTDRRYHRYVGGSAGYAWVPTESFRNTWGSTESCGASVAVGKAYGSAVLQPLIGGSGGGGGRGGANFPGSGGGGGGGAVLIASSGTVVLTGAIRASGGNGGAVAGTNSGGSGGGGSGGAVRIVAASVTGSGAISADPACPQGVSGSINIYMNCSYYASSGGRIRIEATTITYSGTTTPAYTTDTPGPVFLASMPSLRIASVAGVAVPANPTGQADVSLPTDVTNPVTVTFETVNVPTGNTILFKLVPAFGAPTEVLSAAIAGTTAAGTASIQVSLPQGPSTLQATTTYTVVVAMGEALSVFAGNERVERVQLSATLGGANQAKLITVSGKEYVVPMSALQQVGFAG